MGHNVLGSFGNQGNGVFFFLLCRRELFCEYFIEFVKDEGTGGEVKLPLLRPRHVKHISIEDLLHDTSLKISSSVTKPFFFARILRLFRPPSNRDSQRYMLIDSLTTSLLLLPWLFANWLSSRATLSDSLTERTDLMATLVY